MTYDKYLVSTSHKYGNRTGTHPDLVAENLGRRPVNHGLVLVHAVDHDSSASPDVVDALLSKLLNTRRLDDNIESIWVVLLKLLPLRARVLPVQLDVLVSRVQLLRNIHLDTLVSSNNHAVSAVELQQLRENKTSRTSAEQKDVNADGRVELVQSVDGASGGFKEGGFLIGEVVDLVALLLVAGVICASVTSTWKWKGSTYYTMYSAKPPS